MSRTRKAVALALAALPILFLAPASAAGKAAWIAPRALAVQLERSDVREVNRTFRMGEDGPLDGPIAPGQIVSVASLEGLHTVAPSVEPGTWLMYDIERWGFTPDAERAAPYRSMRRFVVAARGYGFVAILAPGMVFRAKAARLDADVFVAQVQSIMDPVKYRAKVCEIVRLFRGPVYAEVTANGRPGHNVAGLMRQWRAGRVCTARFALWGLTDPENVAIAREFLNRAAP